MAVKRVVAGAPAEGWMIVPGTKCQLCGNKLASADGWMRCSYVSCPKHGAPWRMQAGGAAGGGRAQTAPRPPQRAPGAAFGGSGKYPYVPRELEALCVPIDSVRLDPKNPRRNDAAAPKLAELLRLHGFRKPIVVDQRGEIRAGNTAWKAAKLLGMTHIPVVRSEFGSEAAGRAYTISDNKAGEWSEWDEQVLAELMQAEDLRGDASTGLTEAEERFLFMEADIDAVNAIAEDPSGMKAKIIVVLVDAARRDAVRELLSKWLQSHGIEAEVK